MIKSCNFYYFNDLNFVTKSDVDSFVNDVPFRYNYFISSFCVDDYGGTAIVYVRLFINVSRFALPVHSPMKFP